MTVAISRPSPIRPRRSRDWKPTSPSASLVPTDPAVAFIDFLLEDFADEWVTKMMYHYRWACDADVEKSGRLLPIDRNLHAPAALLQQAHDMIIERQVGGRALVGSTDTNQPAIEGSYLRLLDILQAHLAEQPFLLGDRPGRSDVALYGQLKPMLWWDPTPTAIGVERAPRAINWIERVDDLSWRPVEGDRRLARSRRAGSNRSIAAHRGGDGPMRRFMVANAAALDGGSRGGRLRDRRTRVPTGAVQVSGQMPALVARAVRRARTTRTETRVDELLAGTGCQQLLS